MQDLKEQCKINAHTKLKFECKFGHMWVATLDAVLGKRRTWCPQCAGRKNTKIFIAQANIIHKDRGS
jgi:hypothetical protein